MSRIKVKRHSQFVGKVTLTVIGRKWSRTFGILPKGNATWLWLGGINWTMRGTPYGETTKRASLAVCKYRITK